MRLFLKLALLLLLLSSFAPAQTLYMKSTASDVAGYNEITAGRGAGGAATVSTVTLTASGTLIQATPIWITPPFAGSVTLSSAITVNAWAKEAANANNSGIQVRLYKYSGGSEGSVFGTCTFGTELTTTMAAKNYSCTPTSTAFSAGDRLVVKVFFVNCTTSGCPTGTMGSGTGTFDYDRSSAADGESFITLGNATAFAFATPSTIAVNALADLTAQFDVNATAMAPAVTADATVSTFTGSHSSTDFPLAPTISVGTDATVNNAIARNVAEAISAVASVTTFTKAAAGVNYPLAPTMGVIAVADLGAQFDLVGPTAAAGAVLDVTQFTKTGGTDFPLGPVLGVTAAAVAKGSVAQGSPISVSPGLTAQNAIKTTVTENITAAASVSQFTKALVAHAYSYSPAMGVIATGNLVAQFDLNTPLLSDAGVGAATKFDSKPAIQAETVAPVVSVAFGATLNPTMAVATNAAASFGTIFSPTMSSALGMQTDYDAENTANGEQILASMGVTTFARQGQSNFAVSANLAAALAAAATLDTGKSPATSTGTNLTAALRADYHLAPQATATVDAVADFEVNLGTHTYAFTTPLTVATLDSMQLATANQSTAAASADATVAFAVGYHMTPSAGVTFDATPLLQGQSTSQHFVFGASADAATLAKANLATVQSGSAGSITSMTPSFSSGIRVQADAAVGMVVSIAVHRGGSTARRRVVVL